MPDYSDDERLALDFLTVDRPLSPIQERRAREALVRLLIDDREAPLRPVIRAVLGFLSTQITSGSLSFKLAVVAGSEPNMLIWP